MHCSYKHFKNDHATEHHHQMLNEHDQPQAWKYQYFDNNINDVLYSCVCAANASSSTTVKTCYRVMKMKMQYLKEKNTQQCILFVLCFLLKLMNQHVFQRHLKMYSI